LLDVNGPAFVGGAQAARHDRKPTELRELGRDVLHEAIDELLLFGVPGNIRKGKDCYRRLAGKSRRAHGFGVGCFSARHTPFPHVADETKSLAGNGADQLLFFTTIGYCLTCCGNSAAER
jgi:hypothetical protein